MKRLLPVLLLTAGCAAKYYKVQTKPAPLFKERVMKFLREEGGWAELKVKVGKRTVNAPVLDVTPDSVKVFVGAPKKGEEVEEYQKTKWVKTKEINQVTFVMPMEAQSTALQYAKNALLVGLAFTGVATGATFLFEYTKYNGDMSQASLYMYIGGALAGLTLLASAVAYFVGFKRGKARDEDVKKRLRIFLGLESWKEVGPEGK